MIAGRHRFNLYQPIGFQLFKKSEERNEIYRIFF
jgi:hypothetical protein